MSTQANHTIAFDDSPRESSGLILMLEDEEGHCQPVAVCSSASEASEMATDDLRHRIGNADGLVPFAYTLWSNGMRGYRMICEAKVS